MTQLTASAFSLLGLVVICTWQVFIPHLKRHSAKAKATRLKVQLMRGDVKPAAKGLGRSGWQAVSSTDSSCPADDDEEEQGGRNATNGDDVGSCVSDAAPISFKSAGRKKAGGKKAPKAAADAAAGNWSAGADRLQDGGTKQDAGLQDVGGTAGVASAGWGAGNSERTQGSARAEFRSNARRSEKTPKKAEQVQDMAAEGLDSPESAVAFWSAAQQRRGGEAAKK